MESLRIKKNLKGLYYINNGHCTKPCVIEKKLKRFHMFENVCSHFLDTVVVFSEEKFFLKLFALSVLFKTRYHFYTIGSTADSAASARSHSIPAIAADSAANDPTTAANTTAAATETAATSKPGSKPGSSPYCSPDSIWFCSNFHLFIYHKPPTQTGKNNLISINQESCFHH